MKNSISNCNNCNNYENLQNNSKLFIRCCDISNITNEEYQIYYTYATEARKQKANRYRKWEDAKRCILAEILLRDSFEKFFEKYQIKNEQMKKQQTDIDRNSYFDFFKMEHIDILNKTRKTEEMITKDIITEDIVQKDVWDIVYSKGGKPYIKNVDNFFFNLSHSGKWVVAAYGSREIGVDIEKIRQNSTYQKMAKRFFTEEEQNYIYSIKDKTEQQRRFTRIWTLKESYLKYLGVGLKKDLLSFSFQIKNEKEAIVCDIENPKPEVLQFYSYFLREDLEEAYMLSICSEKSDIQIAYVCK
ncbi:MAG: 4'-phosphopantetheinyl transferase superfamily protein [Lachnospiraceae bacterium]|nr:4'-phosphopantetheinyl transferase superfamily protein [Lachnospiraceae bacterium]